MPSAIRIPPRWDCASMPAFLFTRAILPSRRDPYRDRKSTRLNSSHQIISYAVFCLKKKKTHKQHATLPPTIESPPPSMRPIFFPCPACASASPPHTLSLPRLRSETIDHYVLSMSL